MLGRLTIAATLTALVAACGGGSSTGLSSSSPSTGAPTIFSGPSLVAFQVSQSGTYTVTIGATFGAQCVEPLQPADFPTVTLIADAGQGPPVQIQHNGSLTTRVSPSTGTFRFAGADRALCRPDAQSTPTFEHTTALTFTVTGPG